MSDLKQLLDDFILNSKNILYDNLIGIYLHGSLAMGCYNEKKSDIDLLVVVENDLSREMNNNIWTWLLHYITKHLQRGLN